MTFFDYPSGGRPVPAATGQAFLPAASEHDWADLLRLCVIRDLDPGATLIAAGADESALLIVLAGQVEVLLASARKWRRVANVGAGSVVGEMAFLDGGPRSALVRTLAPTRIAELTRAAFDTLVRTQPGLALEVALDIGKIVAQRLRLNQASV